MDIFETYISKIDAALESLNQNGYNLLLSHVGDIIKQLMKLIQNKKPYYHLKKKRYINSEPTESIQILNGKLLDILGDGSLNLVSSVNEMLIESVIRALILSIPFCEISFIETITFTLVDSVSLFPVDGRRIAVKVLADYFIPMNSIIKGEDDEDFQFFCEMVMHSTVGKLGTNLNEYLPLIESIVYWSQRDMLQLLLNTALLSNSIEQEVCVKAIIHYLSPIDIGEKFVQQKSKCNNLFCKNKMSTMAILVMDQTTSVMMGMTSPPLIVCDVCSEQIKSNFKHGIYVPHTKPIPIKTLVYNTDLVDDESYVISCQIEQCSRTAEYLSIAFYRSKSTELEVVFDSMAKYLCHTCHQQYPHTQCQYLFSFTHISKLTKMTDQLVFEMFVDLFLKVLDQFEGITLAYEYKQTLSQSLRNNAATHSTNESTDFNQQLNSSTYSVFFMLSKILGFIVFYKEITFVDEIVNRFSVSQWRPREALIKNKLFHEKITEMIMKSLSFMHRNKQNGLLKISDPQLFDTFKEWLNIMHDINLTSYTSSLYVQLRIPHNEDPLLNDAYTTIQNSFKILESIIQIKIISLETIYDVFFQHLDVVTEMFHVESRFSKFKLNQKQLVSLKANIKALYSIITQKENGHGSPNIINYIYQILSKSDDDTIAKIMWKLRLLSYCKVTLPLQAVLDTIHYFLQNHSLIYSQYKDRLQYFVYETYSDSNICFKCNKSSFFLEVGFIKENCCFRFNAISKTPKYNNQIEQAFYSFICLDLILSTLIPFENKVCIMRVYSEHGRNSLFKVVIDLIRLFSRDGNYPQNKDMCRIFAGTLYFLVVSISHKEGQNLAIPEKEENVNYMPIQFPPNNKTKFEEMCESMCDPNSTLPYIVRVGAIVGHMLYVLCLEDEHHDVYTAASLCTIIKFVFFDEKYFGWCVEESNNQTARGTFTKDILPSLWTSQKYDDLATSSESAKIFLTICRTDKGFEYLVEEIISYTENVLTKFASAAASDVSNIHSDTSNLEMVEQLSVCLYCLTLEGVWIKKYSNGVIFVLFCVSLLILLQNHVHPNVACLSTEFMRNIPDNSQKIIMECINMQYNFVAEDRLFLILISMTLMRTCNVYVVRKNLLLWWNLSFSSEIEDNSHASGFKTSSNPNGISLSSIRVFKEIYGSCMVSNFMFPKTFENFESQTEKNTKIHSLFLVLLSYSIQTLAQIDDVSYKEDILTFNDMFTKLLLTMDIKYKTALLGVPFGKAKHVYLHFMWYLLDKNYKVGQYFVPSVIEVLKNNVEDPGLNPLPSKKLLLEERVVENIKDLAESTDSLNNGIVSLLAEERHMFLKMLNLLLYKYDLATYRNNLKLIMDHIHSVLDGHIHICLNKKKSLLAAAQNDSLNEIITAFELHNFDELKQCASCGVPLFKVDNRTICLSLITLTEFHLHNFKIASSLLYRTINLIYKFSYYDNLYGKFKAAPVRVNSDEAAPPIPLSITSVATKCFHQLIFKLEQLNFLAEFFKIEFVEPYPFFYTLVFAIVVCDSFDAVLKFLSNACQKFISEKEEFFQHSDIILTNFTIILHCSRDILLTHDTHAINYNVMKIRDFLTDINLDIVYGLKSTVFKSDKMSITADLMVDTCTSFDSMIKLISSASDGSKVPPELSAEMVLELIKFNSTTCFYYENLVGFIEKLFKSQNVPVLTMVKIAVQWYCTSADSSDQLTIITQLVDALLVSLRNLIVKRNQHDGRIKNIVVFLVKVAGTKFISQEFSMDITNKNIVTSLETIPSEALSSIVTKKIMFIYDTIHKLYINPTTGLSNRNSRTATFHARIEYVRLPLAQALAVSLEKLSNFQKNLIFSEMFPWLNKNSIQQHMPDNYASMENMIFRMRDIFWLLFGRIAHNVHWNEKLGPNSLMNELNLGLVLCCLNIILDCMCSKRVIITRAYHGSNFKYLVTYYAILCVYGEMTQEFKDDSQIFRAPKSQPYVFTCSMMWTEFLDKVIPNTTEYAIFASLLNSKGKFISAFIQDIYMTSCELVKMGYVSPTCVIYQLEPFLVKIEQGLQETKHNTLQSSIDGSINNSEPSYKYDATDGQKLVLFTPVDVEDNKKLKIEWFDRISSELIDIEKQIL